MISRHIRSRQIRCLVCEGGMEHEWLWSLTSTNPYVVTERVEIIAGLKYGAVCRAVSAANCTGYRLPVDTEHCGQAQQDTGCLWIQNTVGRHW